MSELRFAAASGSGFFTGRTETDGGSLPSGSGRNADRVRTGRAWQTIATGPSADLGAEVQFARSSLRSEGLGSPEANRSAQHSFPALPSIVWQPARCRHE